MKIIQSSKALKSAVTVLQNKQKTIGFVPTMGFLHEGHLSLVRHAKKENDVVIVSIFVNPTQFGPGEDFKKYPRDMARDCAMLKKVKTDILYTPNAKNFYPNGYQTYVTVNELAKPLCGVSRPIHFRGVATVVAKLLHQTSPTRLYLGQKDYQQFKVLERMAQDMDFPVQVKMAPIVREKDGLAMSSRNVYLSPEQRREAPVLHQSLCQAAQSIRSGARKAAIIKKTLQSRIRGLSQARVDYIEIVNAATLAPVVNLKTGQTALLALAVFFGKTRLIDNILVKV